MSELIKPIRIMARLGVKTLIVTNAAGGINRRFNEGTLMLITDHINFLGDNPLIGANDDSLGTRFPDMSNAYDPELRARAETIAEGLGIAVAKGVYLAATGPSYETRPKSGLSKPWERMPSACPRCPNALPPTMPG